MSDEAFGQIIKCVKPSSADLYKKSRAHSDEVLRRTKEFIDHFAVNRFPLDEMCFAVVGSIGRNEALEASDLDIVPLASTDAALAQYQPFDAALREGLRSALQIPVSRGEDLTKCSTIASIVDPESIGGPIDDSSVLTKRILVLTESRQSGGQLPLSSVQRRILESYGNRARSSGRHVLSLCNDIARYYRTLCIAYKWKADDEDADWCTRNLKLRHSRKIWYFSNIISIVHVAETYPRGRDDYESEKDAYLNGLLSAFSHSPIERLSQVLSTTQPLELGRLLDSFAIFLEFMSKPGNRKSLSEVNLEVRYDLVPENPFPAMKFNSDILHRHTLSIIEAMPATTRQRIFDWFLL